MKKTAQCGGFFHFTLGGYLLEAEIYVFFLYMRAIFPVNWIYFLESLKYFPFQMKYFLKPLPYFPIQSKYFPNAQFPRETQIPNKKDPNGNSLPQQTACVREQNPLTDETPFFFAQKM